MFKFNLTYKYKGKKVTQEECIAALFKEGIVNSLRDKFTQEELDTLANHLTLSRATDTFTVNLAALPDGLKNKVLDLKPKVDIL